MTQHDDLEMTLMTNDATLLTQYCNYETPGANNKAKNDGTVLSHVQTQSRQANGATTLLKKSI
jgi:hypothetical protein